METENLRNAIKRRGIKYSAIASHLGVSQPYVSQMLNGQREIPLTRLTEIMNFTGVTADEVYKSTDK